MTLVKWNLIFVHLEIVLVSVQDRFMVCTDTNTISKWMKMRFHMTHVT